MQWLLILQFPSNSLALVEPWLKKHQPKERIATESLRGYWIKQALQFPKYQTQNQIIIILPFMTISTPNIITLKRIFFWCCSLKMPVTSPLFWCRDGFHNVPLIFLNHTMSYTHILQIIMLWLKDTKSYAKIIRVSHSELSPISDFCLFLYITDRINTLGCSQNFYKERKQGKSVRFFFSSF